jgi:hypothetical protein
MSTQRFSKKYIKKDLENMRIKLEQMMKKQYAERPDSNNVIMQKISFIDFLLKRWKLEKLKS